MAEAVELRTGVTPGAVAGGFISTVTVWNGLILLTLAGVLVLRQDRRRGDRPAGGAG